MIYVFYLLVVIFVIMQIWLWGFEMRSSNKIETSNKIDKPNAQVRNQLYDDNESGFGSAHIYKSDFSSPSKTIETTDEQFLSKRKKKNGKNFHRSK